MIRHVVLIRWKANLPASHEARIIDMLQQLPASVPTICRLSWGRDLEWVGGNYDFGLVVDFDDRAGWQAYQEAPEHRALITELLAPWIEQRAAVQFESGT